MKKFIVISKYGHKDQNDKNCVSIIHIPLSGELVEISVHVLETNM